MLIIAKPEMFVASHARGLSIETTASKIGLARGEWPAVLDVEDVHGEMYSFERADADDEGGHWYFCERDRATLHVLGTAR